MRAIGLLILILLPFTIHADPWFTGPLLVEPAQTIPYGHWNIEIFDFSASSHMVYDTYHQLVGTSPNSNTQILPELSYGLADNMDIELEPTFIQNNAEGKTSNNIGDTSAILGIQVLRQDEHLWRPDLRLTFEEILPSGRYDHLTEANHGTDVGGMGSYQTNFTFNFQHLLHIQKELYLNSHLSFGYLFASSVHIKGISAYGGNDLTRGTVKPGSMFTIDIAEELSLTQHWALSLEGYFQYQQSDQFIGDYGKVSERLSPDVRKGIAHRLARLFPTKRNISSLFLDNLRIGNGTVDLLTFAPAIEYNFTKNFGVILGSWFSVYGKNTTDFASFALGVNIFI